MEDEFHEELDRREKEIRRRRESQLRLKASRQPQKQGSNVIEIKDISSPPLSKTSNDLKLKRSNSVMDR